MEKRDLKVASVEVRNELRCLARRLRSKGKTYPQIASELAISVSTAKNYCKSKHTKEKVRGRRPGEQRALNPEQEKAIQKWITDDVPEQYKLEFALWTRKAVVELIREKFNITLSDRAVGNYLANWGFTPQKALRKAYEQNSEAVEKWKAEEYPQIKKHAQEENAVILWADETGVRNDDQRTRGYSPRGKTPVLSLNVKRFRTNMISAISNKGKVHFMVYQETMNAELLQNFLERLQKEVGRKIIVILDNLRVHHAKVIKQWLSEPEVSEKIELRYLPAYSPELNPDEYLNGDFKGVLNRKTPARTQEDLVRKVEESIIEIASAPKRVESYFKHPNINYAARGNE